MKRDTVVSKVRKAAEKADVSNIDFLAVQINLTDQDPGVFYVEVKDHKISVEPYDYHDRNCAISITSEDFNKLISGKLDRVAAFSSGVPPLSSSLEHRLKFQFANAMKGK